MTSKEYVEKLDWSSAIAAATWDLDNIPKSTTNPPPQRQPTKEEIESYLYRGIARCFIANKEGKHKEAIEDLSAAIYLYSKLQGTDIDEAYYYRAYAFYLDSDYQKAETDCSSITGQNLPYKDELLGKIYLAMNEYSKVIKVFEDAIKQYKPPTLPPPGLLDSYREACKRMNSV